MMLQLTIALSLVQERKSFLLPEYDTFTALERISQIIQQYPYNVQQVVTQVTIELEGTRVCHCSSCATEEIVYEWFLLLLSRKEEDRI